MRTLLSPLVLLALTACEGPAGTSDLINVTDEPAGSHCVNGGVKIETGADTNQNGAIEPSEISSTKYVCSGTDGSGVSVLSTVTAEAAGANCAAGGVRIDNGSDTNGDHALQPSEITSTTYVCGAGAAQIVKANDASAIVAANANAPVTVFSAQITTPGAGKLLALGAADAYCAAAECPAGNPAADGDLWVSDVNNGAVAGDYEYFYLTPNTTESMSRTQNFTIAAAGTFTYYLRGQDGTNSFSFYRPSLTLIYLP